MQQMQQNQDNISQNKEEMPQKRLAILTKNKISDDGESLSPSKKSSSLDKRPHGESTLQRQKFGQGIIGP